MATGELADKKKMFELFTAVKDHAVKIQDRDVASIVDESITLWTNMLEADAVHDQTIVDNVQAMQLEGIIFVKKLKELLAQLRAIYVQDMKFFQKVRAAPLPPDPFDPYSPRPSFSFSSSTVCSLVFDRDSVLPPCLPLVLLMSPALITFAFPPLPPLPNLILSFR